MQILSLDFETYYDDTYTLKKMTTEEYVRDPRFEALCLGVVMPDNSSFWVPQENIPQFLASIDWTKTGVIHHHAQFDGLILAHHYRTIPAMFFDTLSMARAKLGNHVRKSLDSLSKHFNLETKSVPYGMFKGRRWANLYPHERQAIGDGAVGDCRITKHLFARLVEGYPTEELNIIDMTVRMFTEPQVYGDTPMLDNIVLHEEDRKRALLMQLGVTDADLQSAATFTKLLENLDIDVEMKRGKDNADGTERWIPAIAKTDDFMKWLLELPEPVCTLAEARLAVRSTLAETRAGRMAAMSRRGALCIYLAYAAAHTMRFGGGDSLNWQNLPRVREEVPAHLTIRGAVSAPADCLIDAPDLSQIECRITNWLGAVCAGNDPADDPVLQAFAAGRDVYAESASRFYKTEMTRKTHPKERQLFKQVELGSGFGLGAERFVIYAKSGVGGPPIHLELHESQAAIQFYRDEHPDVVRLWKRCQAAIPVLAGYGSPGWSIGPVRVEHGYLEGPNGLRLTFPDLEWNYSYGDGGVFEGWSYSTRNGRTKLYGGKLTENVVQFLARIVATQAQLRIRAGSGLRPWLSTHDDLAYVVRRDVAKDAMRWMIDTMKQTPEWMPGIPLDADGEPSERYVK